MHNRSVGVFQKTMKTVEAQMMFLQHKVADLEAAGESAKNLVRSSVGTLLFPAGCLERRFLIY